MTETAIFSYQLQQVSLSRVFERFVKNVFLQTGKKNSQKFHRWITQHFFVVYIDIWDICTSLRIAAVIVLVVKHKSDIASITHLIPSLFLLLCHPFLLLLLFFSGMLITYTDRTVKVTMFFNTIVTFIFIF